MLWPDLSEPARLEHDSYVSMVEFWVFLDKTNLLLFRNSPMIILAHHPVWVSLLLEMTDDGSTNKLFYHFVVLNNNLNIPKFFHLFKNVKIAEQTK